MDFEELTPSDYILTAKNKGEEIQTEIISVAKIVRYLNPKTNMYHVIILGTKGEKFSSFWSVWESQKIDIKKVRYKDSMIITYVRRGKYNNFLKVDWEGDLESQLDKI